MAVLEMEEKKKGKRLKIDDDNSETVLPEALIQHIQSFMTGKEAAQTTVLNKSWCGAWLTRPTLDFDQSDFKIPDDGFPKIKFTKFAKKSMQRYQDLNLKIDRFRLRIINYIKADELRANKLIVEAIKLGATDLDLELRSVALVLPREVLESETLLRLSVSGRRLIDEYNVKCSRLKTLALGRVNIESDDLYRGIISRCISLEELSLYNCRLGITSKMFGLSAMNLPHHPNLRCLSLESAEVDPLFFSDNFDSRFPCLKDLSVTICSGYKSIQIHSTSLETISFVQVYALKAEFNVPNLVTLRYSCGGIPSVSVQSSREWELYISLPRVPGIPSHSWLSKMKNSFTKMTPSNPSKIFLYIKSSFFTRDYYDFVEDECIHEGVGKPVELEDLMMESYSMDFIPVGFLTFCRPKFITLYWLPEYYTSCKELNNTSLDWICKRLMKEFITANRCIPDQNVFGEIGLKEVDVELYEEILTDQWRPLHLLLKEPLDFSVSPENKRRIRFQLRWG